MTSLASASWFNHTVSDGHTSDETLSYKNIDPKLKKCCSSLYWDEDDSDDFDTYYNTCTSSYGNEKVMKDEVVPSRSITQLTSASGFNRAVSNSQTSDTESHEKFSYKNIGPELKRCSSSLYCNEGDSDGFDTYQYTTMSSRENEQVMKGNARITFEDKLVTFGSCVRGSNSNPLQPSHDNNLDQVFTASEPPNLTRRTFSIPCKLAMDSPVKDVVLNCKSCENFEDISNTPGQGPTHTVQPSNVVRQMSLEELTAFLAHTEAEMETISEHLINLLLTRGKLISKSEVLAADAAQVSKQLKDDSPGLGSYILKKNSCRSISTDSIFHRPKNTSSFNRQRMETALNNNKVFIV